MIANAAQNSRARQMPIQKSPRRLHLAALHLAHKAPDIQVERTTRLTVRKLFLNTATFKTQ
jgi:hypothetical protein